MIDARPRTPLLDQIALPADLRGRRTPSCAQIADELRAETISAVSRPAATSGRASAWSS